MKLDRTILAVQPRTEASLRRLADASELAGDLKGAATSWRIIIDSVQLASEPWFEAKYQTLRLLSKLDIDKARAAMREHKVLYPDGGPGPWGAKIAELDASMGPGEPPAAPAPSVAPGAGGPPPSGGGAGGGSGGGP